MAKAYEFEPKKKTCSSSNPALPYKRGGGMEQEESRTMDSSWCLCGRCAVMPTATECICCKELEAVRGKLGESDGVHCITQHGRFSAMCLEPEILRPVLVLLHDARCSTLQEPISNRAYRLCAYRLFTSWIHGRLGAHTRRIIPSCVVRSIRNKFPDDNGVYTGFMLPESDHTGAWPW